jgi:hypothetical protein
MAQSSEQELFTDEIPDSPIPRFPDSRILPFPGFAHFPDSPISRILRFRNSWVLRLKDSLRKELY